MVQGRLHASSAGSAVLITGQGTKIPHATWWSQWSFKKIKNGKWQMLARVWRTLITVKNVNGAATVKNSLAIYIKGKHRVIIWPSISTPKCIPQRLKTYSYKNLNTTVQTTQMSITWWMDKQHVVYTYNGLLLLAIVEQLAGSQFHSQELNPGPAVKAGILTTRPWGNSSYNGLLFRNKKEWSTVTTWLNIKNITLGFKSQLQ